MRTVACARSLPQLLLLLLLLARLPLPQLLALGCKLTNPLSLVLELAVKICICRAGAIPLPLNLDLPVEMLITLVVGHPGRLGLGNEVHALVATEFSFCWWVVASLLDRLLGGRERL